jgi:restriction system protein
MPYRFGAVTHADHLTLLSAAVIAAAMRFLQHLRRKRADRLPSILTPLGLERHCAGILARRGWRANLTARSADQGVDVLARKGRVSVVIQCKLYSRPVGNAAVQEVIAGQAFMGATHAAVVSNQTYTRAARTLAGRTRVLLLSAEDLTRANRLFR